MFVLFLPFLLSLAGQGAMAKMLCLVASILALPPNVEEYWAVLPWGTGTLMAPYRCRIEFARSPSSCGAQPRRPRVRRPGDIKTDRH